MNEHPPAEARVDAPSVAGLAARHRPPWLMSLVGLVLVFVLACILSPVGRRSGALIFLSPGNLSDILRQVSEKGILAVGMTLVILSGGIDLGVGSLLALCATMSAVLVVYGQWGTAEAIFVVLAMGTVLGLFNGAVIAKGRIQPFVVTLAMMLAARGLARILSGGAGVGLPFPAPGAVPHGFLDRLVQLNTASRLALGLAAAVAAIGIGALLLAAISRLPGETLRARLLAGIAKARLPLAIAGGAAGLAAAVWLRRSFLPEAVGLPGAGVLLGSAAIGGLAAGAALVWSLLLVLALLLERRRTWGALFGVSVAVTAGVATAGLCWYMTQLSMAWRTGSIGMAPLSFKLLALRFGPPIEGWNDIIPVPAVLFLLVVAAAHFVMTRTRFGRYVYAIGGNERAALYSGIDVDGVKLRVYAVAGLLSALAGIIHCAQLEQGNPNDGFAYELDAIAAVVVGGTLLTGGSGSVIGTLFGVLIIGVIDNIMGLHVDKIDSNWQLITKGAIIIITVLLQRRRE